MRSNIEASTISDRHGHTSLEKDVNKDAIYYRRKVKNAYFRAFSITDIQIYTNI